MMFSRNASRIRRNRVGRRAGMSARLMAEGLEPRTLLSMMPSPASAVVFGEQEDSLGLRVTSNLGDGAHPISLAVATSPDASIARLQIAITGDGVFHGISAATSLFGPFAPGTFPEADMTLAAPTGQGAGHLATVVQAFAPDGHLISSDQADLFALYSAGTVITSAAGFGDLEYQRLQGQLGDGTIDAAAFDAGVSAIIHGAPPTIAASPARAGFVAAAAPAFPTSVVVSGKIQWTDAAGGTHPVPLAPVEVYGYDGTNSVLLTAVPATTDGSGSYSVTVAPDAAHPMLFIRALAKSPYDDVKPQIPAGATTYTMSSTAFPITGGTMTIDRVASNSLAKDNERAFAVDAAMVMVGTYAANLTGKALPALATIFPQIPAAGSGPVSYFDGTNKLMNVRNTAWNQLDVTDHEYGHYVASAYGFDTSPGGNHGVGSNNAPAHGKQGGLALAWSEGWATYFSISGQDASNASALNIPTYGDHSYDGLIHYSLDSLAADGNAVGEDDEGSVSGVLWQMYLTSKNAISPLQYNDKTIFDIIKAAKPTTLGAFWEAAAAKLGTKQQTQLGKIFGDLNVAPVPTDPADNLVVKASDPIPTFKWHNNGGGAPNPLNEFKVVFYSNDFSTKIFESPTGEVTVGATDSSFTPTADEWRTIQAGGEHVYWFIKGKNTGAPATPGGGIGYYESAARLLGAPATIAFVIDVTGSMGEEIGGVRDALQQYIDLVAAKVPAGDDPPTIELVTFRDAPAVVISSHDLAAVRGAVAGLFASGGGDCPEPSAAALQVAAADIGPGGTILLATDASSDPGIDLSAVIAAVRAKGVSVNVILSGDCSGVDDLGGGGGSFAPAALSLLSSPASTADDDGCNGPGGVCTCDGSGTDSSTVWAMSVPTDPADSSAAGSSPMGTSSEPGGDGPELPQGPIDVTLTDPTDDLIGHTLAGATRLVPGSSSVRGLVGLASGASDFFVVALKAGVRYGFKVGVDAGPAPLVEILDRDGTTVLASHQYFQTLESGQVLSTYTIGLDSSADGDYYVRITGSGGGPSFYKLGVNADPLADVTSSIEGFSSVAYQSGGTFLVRDSVKSGDTAGYVSAMFNVMSSTLGPAVLSSVPGAAPQGETMTLSLTGRGTNWREGETTVAFPSGGITVKSVHVTSPTTLSVVIAVADTGAASSQDVVVTSTLGGTTETATGKNILQVTDALTEPALLSIDPNTLSRGQTADVVLQGAMTAWDSTSTVDFGPGVTVNSVTVVSPTELIAHVTVDPAAQIAFRIAVVTTGGDAVQLSRALFINSGTLSIPQIASLSPSSAHRGRTVDVSIVGANTTFLAGQTTVDFGPGVSVLNVSVVDPTHLTARVEIAPDAALGFRDVVVTTNGVSAAELGGFFVDVAGAAAAVVSVAPNSLIRGQQGEITIKGSNTSFLDGTTAVDFGPGIRTLGVRVLDPTTLVATVFVEPDAGLGGRTVTVTTGAEVLNIPSGFTVAAPVDAAQIVSVTPNSLSQGQQAEVTIKGAHTSFVAGSTTVSFGGGTQILALRVVDATTLIATVLIAPGAGPGARNLVVTTGDQAISFPNALTVVAATAAAADPQVVEVARQGVHMQPTVLQVTYNTAMDPGSTSNAANYYLVYLGPRGRINPQHARVIHVSAARYDAATRTVSLRFKHRLPLNNRYELVILAGAGSGVRSGSGVLLDGARNGQPGTNSETVFGREILQLAPGGSREARARKVHGRAVPHPSKFAARRHH